jgi:hypothetical protein
MLKSKSKQLESRQFTAEYKRAILDEAEACRGEGAIGALLRREGLYSSHLITWRRQREQGESAVSQEAWPQPMASSLAERISGCVQRTRV